MAHFTNLRRYTDILNESVRKESRMIFGKGQLEEREREKREREKERE